MPVSITWVHNPQENEAGYVRLYKATWWSLILIAIVGDNQLHHIMTTTWPARTITQMFSSK